MSYKEGWKSAPLENACVEPRRGSLTGFTFVEVMIVVVLIAVVATIGIPALTKGREHAMGREAKSNLLRIAEAEKNYLLEMEKYYPEENTTNSTISEINSDLRVYLKDVADPEWTYTISSGSEGGGGENFLAIASRKASVGAPYSSCKYSIDNTQDEPVANNPAYCP